MAIVQRIVRIAIDLCFIFERKVDPFRNVLNAAHFGRIDHFIRVVNVHPENRIRNKGKLQNMPIYHKGWRTKPQKNSSNV